jgi:8-oxo-dGTP diphosphatase
MPHDPNVHVGVAAIVPSPGGARGILVMQRVGTVGVSKDGYGSWSVPGGWLEAGETPEVAVVREVLEETGVVVEAAGRAGYTVTHRDDRTNVTLFLRCKWVANAPRETEPDKCRDPQWMHWDEILDGRMLFLPLQTWIDEGMGWGYGWSPTGASGL